MLEKGDIGPPLDDVMVVLAPFGDVHIYFYTFLELGELLDTCLMLVDALLSILKDVIMIETPFLPHVWDNFGILLCF